MEIILKDRVNGLDRLEKIQKRKEKSFKRRAVSHQRIQTLKSSEWHGMNRKKKEEESKIIMCFVIMFIIREISLIGRIESVVGFDIIFNKLVHNQAGSTKITTYREILDLKILSIKSKDNFLSQIKYSQ